MTRAPWTHAEIMRLLWALRLCVDYPEDLMEGRRG